MSRNYELALIVDSQLPEGGVEETIKRCEDFLTGQDATIFNVDRWGVRKLAYEIKKHQQAVYTFVQFQAEPGILPELDRVCKLDESVLRYMVVLLEVDLEPAPSEVEAEEVHTGGDASDGDAEDAEAEGEHEADEEEAV
jgi:small subunit ribosomal protein S6